MWSPSSATSAASPRSRRSPRASPGRLTIVAADALDVDMAALAPRPARIVANLPYNIATPLLIGWLRAEPWPPWYESLTLMFQREVAERIVAAARLEDLRPPQRARRLAGARPRSCSTCRRAPSPRRRRSPRRWCSLPRAGAARLRSGGPGAGDGRGLRPAAQDAPPEPEDARPRRACACWPRPASRRRGGRRRSTSPASSRSPTRWRPA